MIGRASHRRGFSEYLVFDGREFAWAARVPCCLEWTCMPCRSGWSRPRAAVSDASTSNPN